VIQRHVQKTVIGETGKNQPLPTEESINQAHSSNSRKKLAKQRPNKGPGTALQPTSHAESREGLSFTQVTPAIWG